MPNNLIHCSFDGILDGDQYLQTIDGYGQVVTKTPCGAASLKSDSFYKMVANTDIAKSNDIKLKASSADHYLFCYVCALHLYVIYEWDFVDNELERLESKFGMVPPRNSLGGPTLINAVSLDNTIQIEVDYV